jgi:excisionase family DNA binding protein
MGEQALDKQQFASRIGVSVSTLERLLSKGKIKPVRIGGRVLFREHHVTDFLDSVDLSKKRSL